MMAMGMGCYNQVENSPLTSLIHPRIESWPHRAPDFPTHTRLSGGWHRLFGATKTAAHLSAFSSFSSPFDFYFREDPPVT
jgi:hypothetical protein